MKITESIESAIESADRTPTTHQSITDAYRDLGEQSTDGMLVAYRCEEETTDVGTTIIRHRDTGMTAHVS